MTLPIQTPPKGTVTSTPGGGVFFDGPEAVGAFRLIALRSALKLEINTGMKTSRVPLTRVLAQYGINVRTKVKGYRELNAAMVAAGFEDQPL